MFKIQPQKYISLLLLVVLGFGGLWLIDNVHGPANPAVSIRYLTNAELASKVAQGQFETNEVILAQTTITVDQTVCPMNSFPTSGFISGSQPQICVMNGGIGQALSGKQAQGNFAFRYLGPNTLGLIGQITPGSAADLSFAPGDNWPPTGQVFIAKGWLGSLNAGPLCHLDMNMGVDFLPTDSTCPVNNWLSAQELPPLPTTTPMGRMGEADQLQLQSGYHLVEADGARLLDNLPYLEPLYGFYLVCAMAGPCPGDPLSSSRTCSFWRVLGKVTPA
jgi:hypothetical protein